MRRYTSVALAAVGLMVLPLLGAARQVGDGLAVRTVRFYRAADHDQGQTRVKAFVRIPYTLVTPTSSGPDGQLSYEVMVRVEDSTGLALLQERWPNHAAAGLAQPGIYAVEMLEFPVTAGRYRLVVTVKDSVTGREYTTTSEVYGFDAAPAASDLLVSPRIRLAEASDSVPQAGELRMGNAMVTAAAELQLTPLRTQAYYLLEAYSRAAAPGTMRVAILQPDGRALLETPATPVQVEPGGSVLRGQIDLAGLPEGEYRMRVRLAMAGETIERTVPFIMAGLQETLAKEAARVEAERITDEGYFGAMSEAELDSAAAPLIYIATADDNLNTFSEVSPRGKRNFLIKFWQKRDQSPNNPANEVREMFYKAIDYANETFREGGRRATPGWRSDRGRVFARNGAPDDKLTRTQSGFAPPYEVWRYTRGKQRYYIFADRTGFGAYNLIYSNDLQEASRPDWQDTLTPDAVIDVGRWLGISLAPRSQVNFGN